MHAPTVAVEEKAHARTTQDRMARAILAGFTASLTMLLLFVVAYNLALLLSAAPTPSWPSLERTSITHPAAYTDPGVATAPAATTEPLSPPRLWLANLTHNRLIDAGLSDAYLAAGIYLVGGLFWALLYALVEPRLRGPAWLRGVTFALLPTIVSLVVVLPLMGGGLFGLAFGAGPLPIIGNILLHLAYGAILGVMYGPFGDRDASTLEYPSAAEGDEGEAWYEPTAAILLVVGLIVGALAGAVADMLSGSASGLALVGMSNAALILWGGLLGAMLGLFVGSFLGLGRHRSAPRDT